VAPEFLIRQFRRLRLRLPQPWSRRLGQLAYLPKLVAGDSGTRREFAEEPLIERLVRERTPLVGIGVGLTERIVEIPWVLRSLDGGAGTRVLDIGTAFSPVVYKRLLVRQPQTVEVADLADVDILGLRCHVADVRALPFAADSFDVAICISTLEHVGMDTPNYHIASGGGGDVDALRELGRVAQTVFVTVPAGADADMGWQRQYAPSTFRRVADEAGLVVERLEVFAHDHPGGWARAEESAVADRSYGEGATAAAAIICAELRRGRAASDGAPRVR
jgi:SAM-dependent methyltransferase